MNHEKSVALRSKLAQTRDARRDRAEVAADAIESAFADLTLPSGHQVLFNRRHQLSWYLGGPGSSLCWIARKSAEPLSRLPF